MTAVIFQFFDNDFDFLEKPLVVFSFDLVLNLVLIHHFVEFITHQI